MRHVNTVQQKFYRKRVMLLENPQDSRYQGGVMMLAYICGPDDGPSDGGSFYAGWTVEEVKAELEELYGFPPSGWIAIPDQIAGCDDAWIEPVRQARDENGREIRGTWEKLVEGQWVRFTL